MFVAQYFPDNLDKNGTRFHTDSNIQPFIIRFDEGFQKLHPAVHDFFGIFTHHRGNDIDDG